jgi:hypothetical protein
VIVFSAGPALSQINPYPKKDLLIVTPKRITVIVHYEWDSPEEARAIRDRFDRDANGSLDEGERRKTRIFLAEEAEGKLYMTANGTLHELTVTSVAANGLEDPTTSTEPIEIDLVLETTVVIEKTVILSIADFVRSELELIPLTIILRDLELRDPPEGTMMVEKSGRSRTIRDVFLEPGQLWTMTIVVPEKK